MKKMIAALLALTVLAGCTDRTPFGECIGAFDDKKPELEYKMSVKNVVWAVALSETIVVPVVVIAKQTHCPVGARKPVSAQ
jgi:hypothetical protein